MAILYIKFYCIFKKIRNFICLKNLIISTSNSKLNPFKTYMIKVKNISLKVNINSIYYKRFAYKKETLNYEI